MSVRYATLVHRVSHLHKYAPNSMCFASLNNEFYV